MKLKQALDLGHEYGSGGVVVLIGLIEADPLWVGAGLGLCLIKVLSNRTDPH